MTNSYDVDHGLSQCPPGPLEPIEVAAPDTRIRVEVEPDPRGLSVGVWQGSHCIYSGAHPIPAPASPVSTVEQGDGLPVGELVVTGITHQFRPTSETFDLPSGKYALYSLSALAAVTRDWKAIEAAIDEYLDGYELRLDEGCHTPTEFERFLLDDVIAGLLAEDEILALLAARPAPAAGDARDAARYRKVRRKVCIVGSQFHILNLAPTYVAPDAAVELDSVLDAAIAAQRQGDA